MALLLTAGAVLGGVSPLGGDTFRAVHGTITLPTHPCAAVKPPYFRGTDGVKSTPTRCRTS